MSKFQTKNCEYSKIVIPEAAAKVLTNAGVELKDYYTPARGAEAELASMRYQASRTQPAKHIDAAALERAYAEAVKHYPTTHSKLSDLKSESYLASIVGLINPDASPGFPFGHLYKTNKDLMANQVAFRHVVDLAVWRAFEIARIGPETIEAELLRDPTWAVRHNLCDPMRTFGKDEAHKWTKVQVQRWRLIFSESIVDQLVERLLFTKQDSAEIKMWQHIPSKSGMGLTAAHVDELLIYAQKRNINTGSDTEGWDWNAPDVLIRGDAQCRILLNQARDPQWERAVMGVTVLHSYRLLMLSDGRIFRRENIGGQASGRKITSSGNGRARFLIDVMAGHHFGYQAASMTQGDDDVTALPDNVTTDDYQEYVRKTFGVTLTDVEKHQSELHFCSQVMKRGPHGEALCIPENPLKQFVNFVRRIRDPDRDQAAKMLEENFRDLPEKDAYLEAIRLVRAE